MCLIHSVPAHSWTRSIHGTIPYYTCERRSSVLFPLHKSHDARPVRHIRRGMNRVYVAKCNYFGPHDEPRPHDVLLTHCQFRVHHGLVARVVLRRGPLVPELHDVAEHPHSVVAVLLRKSQQHRPRVSPRGATCVLVPGVRYLAVGDANDVDPVGGGTRSAKAPDRFHKSVPRGGSLPKVLLQHPRQFDHSKLIVPVVIIVRLSRWLAALPRSLQR
mmetsp:Transcript_50438/g.107427  ORF Transcript_50438/g.107427 Transcript_50438/m.107427 type:complete len:216 (-) Transcript_50438:633-1280(-)